MSDFDLEERTRANPEEIANSLKQEWDSPAFDGKYLLLVEHTNDKECYFKLFNHDKVEIKTTQGCNSMKKVFSAFQQFDIPNFAIQDSDFSRVCGNVPVEANYFITDCHDHEMMCLHNEEVMKDVFANKALDYDNSLVSEVFDDLKLLSYFKWYNYHNHLNVKFKGYSPRGKSKNDLKTFDAIYNIVRPRSIHCTVTITEADVTEFVRSQTPQDVYEITNGHDFLGLFSQYICEKHHIDKLTEDDLRLIVYACFTPNRFMSTTLYSKIRDWAGVDAEQLFAA